MFAHYQLRTKLWLAFFGVVLVSVVLVSFFNSRTLRQELVQDVGAGLQTVASSQAQAVGDWVAKEVDTLQALSVNRVIQEELALLRAQTAAFNRPPRPRPTQQRYLSRAFALPQHLPPKRASAGHRF